MLELGDQRRALHAEWGRAAAAAGLELLIAVGGAPARASPSAAVAAGMPDAACRHVADQRGSGRRSRSRLVRPGDLVLVKGSRGIAHGRGGRAAEGGVRLMLYHLLYPLHTQYLAC